MQNVRGARSILLCLCAQHLIERRLARPMINVPMLQIDRPMMELAVNTGKDRNFGYSAIYGSVF